MKLYKLSSLIAAATLLSVNVPALANPFAPSSSSLFNRSGSNESAGNVVNTGSGNNKSSNYVGNEEIKGLGDHQSWVNPNIFTKNASVLCDDIGLGNNNRTNSTKLALANSNSSRSSSSKNHNDGGGGGFSIFGIGANGNGSTQGSENNSTSKDSSNNRNEENSSSSSTVEKGKNCAAFVNSAALRDMNYQDNLTQRYGIKVGRRGQQVDNLLKP